MGAQDEKVAIWYLLMTSDFLSFGLEDLLAVTCSDVATFLDNCPSRSTLSDMTHCFFHVLIIFTESSRSV